MSIWPRPYQIESIDYPGDSNLNFKTNWTKFLWDGLQWKASGKN